MKLFAIEANTIKLDGGSMFGNAPKMLWQKWITCDVNNRIPLACRTLLWMKDDGRNILFEAGAGPFFEPKFRDRYGIEEQHRLLENLKVVGIEEKDIHVIILSHLHFDHAGGLLSAYEEGPLRLLFPNAKYYLSKRHWEYACNPHLREQASFIPNLQSLLETSGRLVLIDSDQHIDLEGCRFYLSEGHTIGLMLSELNLPSGPLLYASDLIPGLPWLHLPITMGYDRFPALLVDEKKNHLERISKNEGFLFFSHDLQFKCIQVCQDERGRFIKNDIENKIIDNII